MGREKRRDQTAGPPGRWARPVESMPPDSQAGADEALGGVQALVREVAGDEHQELVRRDPGQLLGHLVQRLLPARDPEVSAPAQHRLARARRMVGRLGKAEAAAYAQLAVVDLDVVGGAHRGECAVLVRQLHLTSEAAERAGRGDGSVGPAIPLGDLVGQCPRGADRHARAAELTAGLHVRAAEGRPDQRGRAAVLEGEHGGATHLGTHPYAASAQDAEVVVAVEERVVVLDLEAPVEDRVTDSAHAEPLHHRLQLALSVLGAVATAGRDAGLADRRLTAAALLLLVADEAAEGVLREDELKDLLAHLAQGDGVGGHLHAVLRRRAAGQRVATHARDLHRTQAAAAKRRQLLV